MARLFISHLSVNNAAVIALCEWLSEQEFDNVFLDVDPDRGLVAGHRRQEALKAAADRAVRRCFGLIDEPVPLDRVPPK